MTRLLVLSISHASVILTSLLIIATLCLVMSFPTIPQGVSLRDTPQDKAEATALPITHLPSLSPGSEDVEFCRSESVADTQEASILKRGSSTALSAWRNVSMLFSSVKPFWSTPELTDFWKEVPQRIEYHRIHNYTEGIPRLAALINSDDDFCIWRSFGQLHSRVLLHKMLELVAIEKQLNELDVKDDEADETRYRLQSVEHRDGWDTTQKNLIERAARKLMVYDDLLLKKHALKSLPKPSKSNYESVLNWVWKEQPIEPGPSDYIFKIQDFVRLGLRPQNSQFYDRLVRWISRWTESPLNVRQLPERCHKRLSRTTVNPEVQKLFRDSKQHQDGTVYYYSPNRLGFLIKSIIIFLVISILMVPILLLFMIPMPKDLMAVVVLISLFVFTIVLSLFQDSRPQDIFLGTATYCTVLLVFLSQTNLTASTSAT